MLSDFEAHKKFEFKWNFNDSELEEAQHTDRWLDQVAFFQDKVLQKYGFCLTLFYSFLEIVFSLTNIYNQ